MMDTAERRVVDAVDVDGMLQYLGELVAIPSVTGHETPAQENVAAQLAHCGLEVDVWELDFEELANHPAFSIEVPRQHGLGVVGTLGGEAAGPGRDLIYNGHVDVVPAGDSANWHYDPWQATLADGRIYGRGSADMKGGLCCALYAAKAIHDAQVQLRGKLMVQSVIGEEDGGVGTLAAIMRGYRADGAVVVEPTQLTVAPAQAGALNFRVTVPGHAAHGSMRTEGVSAIEKFGPLYTALMELESERNRDVQDPLYSGYDVPFAICIGRVRGGNWASTVAESLTFEGRFGVAVGEDVLAARRAFEERLFSAAEQDPWLRNHPPQLEWWGGQFEPAHIAADHPVVQTVQSSFGEITGTRATIAGVPYGADMRLLVNEGNTPAVLFGPGDVRKAHQPDEYVPIDDLVATARTLALVALRFCGHKGD
jgi:acetylornithine deacetylase